MRGGCNLLLIVETYSNAMQNTGAVQVVLHVLLAGPDQFHRFPDSFRDDDNLKHKVRDEPSTKAATEQCAVDLHFLHWNVQRLRDNELGQLLALRRCPHFATLVGDPGSRIHGLHWSVRQKL